MTRRSRNKSKCATQEYSTLRATAHGQQLESLLSSVATSAQYADVKMICADKKVFWSHRVILSTVSPFLKCLLVSSSCESVSVVHLPQIRSSHLRLVLDYVYTGAMFLAPTDLAGVLRVIEVLRMKCGVSVSKMVVNQHKPYHNQQEMWVEQKKFVGGIHLLEKIKAEEEIKQEEDDRAVWNELAEDKQQVKAKQNPKQPEKKEEKEANLDHLHVEVLASDSDDDDSYESRRDEGRGQGHVCVMCAKAFQHEANLRIHIQSHLGARAVLNTCNACQRNFRSRMEYDLHLTSHTYAKFLRRSKASLKPPKSVTLSSIFLKRAKKIIIAKQKRINEAETQARLLLPKKPNKSRKRKPGRPKLKRENKEETKKAISRHSLKLKVKFPLVNMPSAKEMSKVIKATTCPHCLKDFSTIRSRERHEMTQHRPVVTRRRKSTPAATPKLQTPKPQTQRSIEEDMTCPTCDKTFLAKSIFERHLKTYKHGVYFGMASTPDILPPDLPHLNPVVQPKMEVGGIQVNKYECHLCNKVFLRVKDLAKHREKTCTAWIGAAL